MEVQVGFFLSTFYFSGLGTLPYTCILVTKKNIMFYNIFHYVEKLSLETGHGGSRL